MIDINFFYSVRDYFKKSDKVFWIISFMISCYCLTLLLSVSRTGQNSFKTQLSAMLIGYAGAFVLTKIDYQVVARRWYVPASICVFLIVFTLIFGKAEKGADGIAAKAWIKLPGGISFQPSELAKVCFMLTFAKHLSYIEEKGLNEEFKHIALLGMHALVPIALTHLQKDDGAAIIFFFMFLTMSFAAKIKLRYFGMIFLIIVVAAPVAWKYVLSEYQKKRFIIQFDLESDPLFYGFQQIQGRISIASGRLFGRGIFKGPRVAYDAVPIQESDFIFSVAGEELGFIGCVLIILLLGAMLLRTVYIADRSCDNLGKYICFGFFGMIFSQTLFNLGMCLCILPVMGVTLPFFSAGGSSAACLYFGLGLVQNVYMHKDDKDLVTLSLKKV